MMRLAKRKAANSRRLQHHYEVTLPDGRIKSVTLDAKASGLDCLQMICKSLGVQDESDYFGLTYPGSRGEELWVNSRNRLAKQVRHGCRAQLRLAVRFFVQPHMLVLEETRHLFLLEARRRAEPLLQEARSLSLEQLSSMRCYGCHFYSALDCYRVRRCVSVGPQGVCICGEDYNELERYAFPLVQKVTKSGRCVYLSLSNADGSPREVGFRLLSSKAATGLYRCVTETHSFFRCDTVRTGVSEQKCRHFKDTLVSLIFTESDVCSDPKFVFDVRRTAREVHDCARRRQFRLCAMAAACETRKAFAEAEGRATAESGAEQMTLAALKLRLESLLQERLCRVCADQDLSVVFVPCGHAIACTACADRLTECPVCRQPISAKQQCFIDVVGV